MSVQCPNKKPYYTSRHCLMWKKFMNPSKTFSHGKPYPAIYIAPKNNPEDLYTRMFGGYFKSQYLIINNSFGLFLLQESMNCGWANTDQIPIFRLLIGATEKCSSRSRVWISNSKIGTCYQPSPAYICRCLWLACIADRGNREYLPPGLKTMSFLDIFKNNDPEWSCTSTMKRYCKSTDRRGE